MRGGELSGEQFNLGKVNEVLAQTIGSRVALIQGEKRFTYSEMAERSRRLASFLCSRGFGAHKERAALERHESGQDHLGLYLYNGNEYVEGMLGSYKARRRSFQRQLPLRRGRAPATAHRLACRGLVYHATFAPVLERVLPKLHDVELLLQVSDSSGNALLPDAIEYEEALASAPAGSPPVEASPDDLYIVFTGGTTGLPKGVLWRQHDIFIAAMGGRMYGTWEVLESYEQLEARLLPTDDVRVLNIPPLIHAAAQWATFYYMSIGATVVFATDPRTLDAAEVWRTVERERVIGMSAVGDAMARPLVDELDRNEYDTSSVIAFGSGGAILSEPVKQRLLAHIPNLVITDVAGASETGVQMGTMSVAGSVSTGRFTPGPGTTVLSEDLEAELEPGDEAIGWLAQRGAVPLGYLGDPEKTARTFPVIGETRFSVPGDRARYLESGDIELLGRDSVTINSGGEKIFAEEVEQAIVHHRTVADVVVAGRPSERWGQEVVAIVQVAEGEHVTVEELLEEASKHVARYKLPKAVAFEAKIVRSPAGKADYRWARERALEA